MKAFDKPHQCKLEYKCSNRQRLSYNLTEHRERQVNVHLRWWDAIIEHHWQENSAGMSITRNLDQCIICHHCLLRKRLLCVSGILMLHDGVIKTTIPAIIDRHNQIPGRRCIREISLNMYFRQKQLMEYPGIVVVQPVYVIRIQLEYGFTDETSSLFPQQFEIYKLHCFLMTK